jgi:hypothetical protein
MDSSDFAYTNILITEEFIPIMLEAFAHGTRFQIHDSAWTGTNTGLKFVGRYYFCCSNKFHFVRVTNDERRRLIPVLKRQLKLQSHQSQK